VRNGLVSFISSPALLAELDDVLSRAKFDTIFIRTNTARDQVLTELRQLAEVIKPPPLQQALCCDPDDDAVVALALAARAAGGEPE
jgi:uncharacterized protein